MTAAFMWPGAEEPIGEIEDERITIDLDACERQGISSETARRGAIELFRKRYAGSGTALNSFARITAGGPSVIVVELTYGGERVVVQ